MRVPIGAAGREEFLAGVHAGVLGTVVGTAGRMLAVSVWYSYQPGGLLTVLTGRRSCKAAARTNRSHRVRDLDRSRRLVAATDHPVRCGVSAKHQSA